MEPFLIIVVPGVIGGLVVALLTVWLGGGASRDAADVRLAPASPGIINMARIRVAGFGGLGMVAMSFVVAIFVPRIRLTMALALVLGTVLAGILIAQRRREGPWSSSSRHPGAHTMFPLDTSRADGTRERASPPDDGQRDPAPPAMLAPERGLALP